VGVKPTGGCETHWWVDKIEVWVYIPSKNIVYIGVMEHEEKSFGYRRVVA
jgi:hypothetical protein